MEDNTQHYTHSEGLTLESGTHLPVLDIAYHTFGKLNAKRSNVIWIFHALTANTDISDWWVGLYGEGKLFDPERYFIICANMLGSCYGASSPQSKNPETGKPYFLDFPTFTVRDMVRSHQILAKHLGIEQIHLGIGGSMGGQQLLEWAINEPERFERIMPIATNAKHSAWGIGFNEAQRMALEADPEFRKPKLCTGTAGLKAARAIAMLSYRHYDTYYYSQQDEIEKIDDFKASSYQRYQGEKLSKRFCAHSYYYLSKAMDSHNVGRGRGGIAKALARITAKTQVVGISSDVLFPVHEQKFLADHIPNGEYAEINSYYGHDGFLVEFNQLGQIAQYFMRQHPEKQKLEKFTEKINKLSNNL